MFDGPDYPAALDEDLFENWLEEGRQSPIAYTLMLVMWDESEWVYFPKYLENKGEVSAYQNYGESVSSESFVAIYDLYSESRLLIDQD